jgi:hypothetical protein
MVKRSIGANARYHYKSAILPDPIPTTAYSQLCVYILLLFLSVHNISHISFQSVCKDESNPAFQYLTRQRCLTRTKTIFGVTIMVRKLVFDMLVRGHCPPCSNLTLLLFPLPNRIPYPCLLAVSDVLLTFNKSIGLTGMFDNCKYPLALPRVFHIMLTHWVATQAPPPNQQYLDPISYIGVQKTFKHKPQEKTKLQGDLHRFINSDAYNGQILETTNDLDVFIHPESQRYYCKWCNNDFTRRNEAKDCLRTHIRHTPYRCKPLPLPISPKLQ